MSFTPSYLHHVANFNSAATSKLLQDYKEFVVNKIREDRSAPKQKTFAPSSMRCDRCSWFRLRGTAPDVDAKPDATLDFKAYIGECCHTRIQTHLKELLGDQWLDVSQYVKDKDFPYTCETEQHGLETRISIPEYYLKFACDGLILFNNEPTLLEIKSVESEAFLKLTEPQSKHITQVSTYCSFLQLSKVVFIYIDRTYGDLKMFEISISLTDRAAIREKMKRVLDAVASNIPPEKLQGDANWCSMCVYKTACKQWG